MKRRPLNEEFPELMAEWNYKKNGDLDPSSITAGCNKKVWWTCKQCGHEWEAVVSNRTRGSGCPNCRYACSVKKRMETVLKKSGSLADVCPELLREWDYEKNQTIVSPDAVSPNSNLDVYWICEKCGHKWRTRINNRTHGSCCLKCSYATRQIKNRKVKKLEK